MSYAIGSLYTVTDNIVNTGGEYYYKLFSRWETVVCVGEFKFKSLATGRIAWLSKEMAEDVLRRSPVDVDALMWQIVDDIYYVEVKTTKEGVKFSVFKGDEIIDEHETCLGQ